MNYSSTVNFKDHETQLVQIILEAVAANAIYLLGSTAITRRTESIFNTPAPAYGYTGHYYILVLLSDKEDVHAAQDIIENRCRHLITVTAIVLKTSVFNVWFAEGHRFAHTVCKMSTVLHGAKEMPPETYAITGDALAKINNSIYTQGYNKVTEFIAGAELYMLRKQTKMAAFMLHQAAEQVLHTLFQLRTGMYVNSHNLDKLLRYCSMLCSNVTEIFPRNTEKEERLFQLLQNAYVGGRYKEEYTVTPTELQKVFERVLALKEVIKNCVKDIH